MSFSDGKGLLKGLLSQKLVDEAVDVAVEDEDGKGQRAPDLLRWPLEGKKKRSLDLKKIVGLKN